MAWIYLFIACLCEIAWSGVGLKYAGGGGTNLKAALLTFVGNGSALLFVMLASKSLPVSIVYPILVGMGVAGSVTIGICFFGESAHVLKIVCIALIFIGVVGLKLMEKGS